MLCNWLSLTVILQSLKQHGLFSTTNSLFYKVRLLVFCLQEVSYRLLKWHTGRTHKNIMNENLSTLCNINYIPVIVLLVAHAGMTWMSLMSELLGWTSQRHAMYCHNLEVMGLNSSSVEDWCA